MIFWDESSWRVQSAQPTTTALNHPGPPCSSRRRAEVVVGCGRFQELFGEQMVAGSIPAAPTKFAKYERPNARACRIRHSVPHVSRDAVLCQPAETGGVFYFSFV